MQILEMADQQYRLILTPAEARTFINCFAEAEKAIGERELPIRLFGPLDQIRAIFSAIEAALK